MSKIRNFVARKIKWLTGLVLFSLSVPAPAFALSFDSIANFFATGIFYFFSYPAVILLKIELYILPLIAQYNNFTREEGVIAGWVAVRDVVNSFFIFLLLIIAMATILRISSYGYKQLLSKLLIVAILVNFSMSIVGLLIDVSQIIMLTFVDTIKDITAGNIMVGLGLQNAFSFAQVGVRTAADVGDFIVSLLLASAMIWIVAILVGSIIAMLAFRIISLWIIIVLAPFAFLASVFPGMRKYYNMWTDELGKNLFAGPALIFFLWLSFMVLNGLNVAATMGLRTEGGMDDIVGSSLTTLGAIATPTSVLNYIIGIALLMGGMKFAASSGAAGAGAVGWASNKVNSTASNLGRRYAGGAASRLGATAGRQITDNDGNLRTAGVAGRVNLIANKVPFWGGRLQRSAMKLKGYDAQRIASQAERDQRYVSARERKTFQESQSKVWGQDLAGTTLGKAVAQKLPEGLKDAMKRGATTASFMTSGGGGRGDAEVSMWQNRVRNGEVNDFESAVKAYKALDRVNDQNGIDVLNKQWPVEISDRDATRAVDERGERVFLNTEAESYMTKNAEGEDVPTIGGLRLLTAALSSQSVSGIGLANATKTGDKPLRQQLTRAMLHLAKTLEDPAEAKKLGLDSLDSKSILQTEKGDDGLERYKITNTGELQLDSQHPYHKLMTFITGMYPGSAAAMHNEEDKHINDKLQNGNAILAKSYFTEGGLKQIEGESDKHFTKRKEDTIAKVNEAEAKYANSQKTDDDRNTLRDTLNSLAGYFRSDEADARLNALPLDEHMNVDKGRINVSDAEINNKLQEQGIDKSVATAEQKAAARKKIVDEKAEDIEVEKSMYMTSSNKLFDTDAKEKQLIEESVKQDMAGKKPIKPNFDEDEEYQVSKSEIQEEARKMVTADEITDRLKKDGWTPDASDQTATKEKREEVREILAKEKETEAENNLKSKKHDKFEKANDEYITALDKYNKEFETKKLDLAKAFADIKDPSKSSNAAKLVENATQISNEKDKDKLAKLLQEQNALLRAQAGLKREAANAHLDAGRDLATGAVVRDVNDGMDYARLYEIDVADAEQRRVFKNYARHASQDQQAQLLRAGTPIQIKIFANTLARTGKKVSKVITDNLEPTVKNDLFKLMWEMKYVREGMDRIEAKQQAASMNDADLSKIK